MKKGRIKAAPASLGAGAVREGKVWLHYSGWHASSGETAAAEWKLFDSSRARHTPFIVRLGREETIAGLEAALAGMPEGERALVTVPPGGGFGRMGNPMGFHGSGGAIPADSWLFFDIEVLLTEATLAGLSADNTALKDEGNKRFALGLFAAARLLYATALEKSPSPALAATLTANMMAACLREGDFEAARSAGQKYLGEGNADPEHPQVAKILFRQAKANAGLSRWTDASEMLSLLATRPGMGPEMAAEVRREQAAVQQQLARLDRQERLQFAGLFDRLEKEPAAADLYAPEDIQQRHADDMKERQRECPFCRERIDVVQYPRHIIKFHSGKPK